MENSRNNDELIRNKLNSYSVEPGKLSFDKVESKFKKVSFKAKWGFTGGVASAVLIAGVVGYFTLSSSLFKTGASNKITSSPTKNLILTDSNIVSEQNTIHANSNDKIFISPGTENKNISSEFNSRTNDNKTVDNNPKDKITDNRTNENNFSPVETKNKNLKKETLAKTNTYKDINRKPTSRSKFGTQKEYNTTNAEYKYTAKENAKKEAGTSNNMLFKAMDKPGYSDKKLNKETNENNQPVTASEKTSEGNKLDTSIVSNKPEDLEATEWSYLEQKKLSPYFNQLPNEMELLLKDSFPFYVQKPKSKIALILSAEASYNTINPDITPNTAYVQPAADTSYKGASQYFPSSFAQAFTPGKYNFISGSVALGAKYKNIGFEAGIGFLSVETTVNTKNLGYKKPVYVVDSILVDTFQNPIDTTYKIGYYTEKVIVNGDSTGSGEYLNNLRFFTIPLKFSYSFNLYRRRIWLEPMAGVQITIPLSSYQLVALKPSEFEYSKSKTSLRKKWLLYDLSAKLSYKFTPSAAIYLRGGYLFGNKSAYDKDYPVNFKIKNAYAAFGVTINIK